MQMTAYELRISDWSSDVCSSDLRSLRLQPDAGVARRLGRLADVPCARRPHRRSLRAQVERAQPVRRAAAPQREPRHAGGEVAPLCGDRLDARETVAKHPSGAADELERDLGNALVEHAELCGGGAGDVDDAVANIGAAVERKSTRLNSSHSCASRMQPSA